MLRSLPTARLIAACIAVVLVGGSVAAIALGAGSGAPPAPRSLADALHRALTAPEVPGVSARITFTNHLIEGASVQGHDPLLSGATGRLWVGTGGRVRLELQSEAGDAQLVSDGRTVSVYDPAMKIAYRFAVPAEHAGTTEPARARALPTVGDIQRHIDALSRDLAITGPAAGVIARRGAYTVKVAPKANGGLVGALSLAWDAARGVPLRAAIYARGSSTPALELRADRIRFGAIPASRFSVPVPDGAKVQTIDTRRLAAKAHRRAGAPAGGHDSPVTDPAAVAKTLAFTLAAPPTLAGMPRNEVRALGVGAGKGALVTYGQGLGGIALLEQVAEPGTPTGIVGAAKPREGQSGLDLPTFSVPGATAQELDTALGTVVRFTRAGVTYTVVGSVGPEVAKAAARGV